MNQVLVNSTGIIGMPMPMDRILPRTGDLVAALSEKGSNKAAQAIMTSDTKPKSYAIEVKCQGHKFRVGGIAKGAGMICPNMATMLAFITTDAAVDGSELKRATQAAVEQSFNRITIDGDTSTNDSLFLLASGAAGNAAITADGAARRALARAVGEVAGEIARLVAARRRGCDPGGHDRGARRRRRSRGREGRARGRHARSW